MTDIFHIWGKFRRFWFVSTTTEPCFVILAILEVYWLLWGVCGKKNLRRRWGLIYFLPPSASFHLASDVWNTVVCHHASVMMITAITTTSTTTPPWKLHESEKTCAYGLVPDLIWCQPCNPDYFFLVPTMHVIRVVFLVARAKFAVECRTRSPGRMTELIYSYDMMGWLTHSSYLTFIFRILH